MKIGLTTLFGFRPHVEHMVYLANILKEDGHETSFLTCDRSVSKCFNRVLKDHNSLIVCSTCIFGGVRSYPVSAVHSVDGQLKGDLPEERLREMVASSTYSLSRIETGEEMNDPEVLKMQDELMGSAATVYESTRQWIQREQLEAVLLFNGRMDIMRAALEACRDQKIPFITIERPWFCHGIQMNYGDNCLELNSIHQVSQEYSKHPLRREQALLAGKLISERFFREQKLEWRVYNKEAEKRNWPGTHKGLRVFIAPGSRSEVMGHRDYEFCYGDNITRGLDAFMEKFDISGEQMLVRCHPIWNQNVGQFGGHRAEKLYSDWAAARGVHLIPSHSRADSYDLLQEADILITNGGSMGLEAAAMGMKIICLGPSIYQKADVVPHVLKESDWDLVEKNWERPQEETIRKSLRFFYTMLARYPQYVEYVRAAHSTEYRYQSGAKAQRIIDLLQTGQLTADDTSFAENMSEEDIFVQLLLAKKWREVLNMDGERNPIANERLHRRWGLRWIDRVRSLLPPGDRL